MTTYRRRGHWRRSPGGGRHWVDPHYVTRNRTSGWPPQRSWASYPRAVPTPPLRSFPERLLSPNARCPVCGAPVFFYSNEHGSRVFFDEVGPPWPKHPCTDTSSHRGYAPAPAGGPTPAGPLHHVNAWPPYVLVEQEAGDGGTTLTLRKPYTMHPVTIWRTAAEVPLAAGDILFIKAGQMSYFDISRDEPVTLPVAYVDTRTVVDSVRHLWRRLFTSRAVRLPQRRTP
ncbi:hypothetical protein AB0F83_17555 [Micromonospora chalcea]|uniref:hypothetical protein n=1 Tax=Micromonospora chalcea TaxID=1874 RepID=UPI0033DA3FB7